MQISSLRPSDTCLLALIGACSRRSATKKVVLTLLPVAPLVRTVYASLCRELLVRLVPTSKQHLMPSGSLK
jgi:hypothetical protein